jgi:hypothetical protein
MTTNTVSGSSSGTPSDIENLVSLLTTQQLQAIGFPATDGPSSRPTKKQRVKAGQSVSKEKPCDEYTLQRDCINWLKSAYPDLQNKYTATVGGAHLKNGPITYNKLRASGYLPGIPDVLIFKARHPFHGLFVEMKTTSGRVTEQQTAVHEALRFEGYMVTVCRSIEQFQTTVSLYLRAPWLSLTTPPAIVTPLHDVLGMGDFPSPILE